jgi:integrase
MEVLMNHRNKSTYRKEHARRSVQRNAALRAKKIPRRTVPSDGLASALRMRRVRTETRRGLDTPTAGEVARLLGDMRGWIRTAVALGAYAGLRLGEIRALEVRDVDVAGDRLFVRRTISGDEVDTPKSFCKRVVPIVGVLRPILEQALRVRRRRARVITNTRGQSPSRRQFLARLNTVEHQLGMRPWSFHALRSFFCSTVLSFERRRHRRRQGSLHR